MKLNLGCGTNVLPGWENHDADVDITKPLPWGDRMADYIFIEHCVEHVSYHHAVQFFYEALRVLKPGGVLRVTVPSIEKLAKHENQKYYDWVHKKGWAPDATKRGAMHAMIWCHGHKQAWTASLMHSTLFYVGYTDVVERAPGESTHIPLQGVEGHGKVIGEEFNALESMCFEAVKPGRTAAVTAPDNNLLPRDLNVDYDAKFYNMHVSWHSEYERIAELLIAMMPFDSAVDFGCGNGYIVQHLARKGKIVLGIDGSENVLKHYPDALIRDLTQPLDVGQHDLVICTEVAEHIEEKYADTLVETVCRASRDWVFFSAAKAGYGGHLHVNEQERPYWYEKFAKHGFVVQHDISNEICNVLGQLNKQTWWFANNCFVMRRQRRIAIVVGDAECVSTM